MLDGGAKVILELEKSPEVRELKRCLPQHVEHVLLHIAHRTSHIGRLVKGTSSDLRWEMTVRVIDCTDDMSKLSSDVKGILCLSAAP